MSTHQSQANARGGRLAISLGDPAGIGAEVVLKALAGWPMDRPQPLLVGCRRWLERTHAQLRPLSPVPLADPAGLELVDLPLAEDIAPGQAGAASG
ncbi:MAG: 4-hydroxythreonine-4-phosphate dehydrogenase, partial [Cyanobium sp.]